MKSAIRTTALVVLAVLAMMATANSTHNQRKPKKPAPTKQLKLFTAPSITRMVGTWTMRDGEKPRKDIRMIFRPNGTFAFVGPNWNSAGTFKCADHKLSLEWTKVDGSSVKPGVMKKDFAMSEDDASFTIDRYTYFKLAN